MNRACLDCGKPFDVDDVTDGRIRKKYGEGHGQKVCPKCVLTRIFDLASDSVYKMTPKELEAELAADGIAQEELHDAFNALGKKTVPIRTPHDQLAREAAEWDKDAKKK